MTDIITKRHLIDLTVIATASLVLGGATLLAANVDTERRAVSTAGTSDARSQDAAPTAGLVRAPKGKRSRVVRRSRAS